VQCLIIICRNFDNIPFIASCNYVSQTVGIAATVIHQVHTSQHLYFIAVEHGIDKSASLVSVLMYNNTLLSRVLLAKLIFI
jgi:hypothetical protein